MVAELGVKVRVRPGYLYSSPTVAECLAQLDPRDTAVLPMSPFSSRFTIGAYRTALAAAGGDGLSVVEGWRADRRYLAALSRRLHETLDGADATSSPCSSPPTTCRSSRSPRATPTSTELQQTVAQLLPTLMPGDWRLAFQSKGRRGGEWLEPEAVTAVRDLAAGGWKNLLVAPLGFVADHVETLFDLDIELREIAASSGVAFLRSPALNDAAYFIEALADIIDRPPGAPSADRAGRSGQGRPIPAGWSLGFGGPAGPDGSSGPGDA